MWPKGPYRWIENRVLHVSVPFTWNLPGVRAELMQRDFQWDRAVVGGPAVDLMPEYITGLEWVEVGGEMPGILQRINYHATRTTLGCPNNCEFCGIGKGKIEAGAFWELSDWPDLPVVCDNNLLAASLEHIDRVTRRLERWGWADFNQGLDARLMTPEKARMIARIREPRCRMAVDSASMLDAFLDAAAMLRTAGIAKKWYRAPYVLVGFNTGPSECWGRCLALDALGYNPSPMWYHRLDALEWNGVTDEQQALGWTDAERVRIMRYFYKRCGTPPGGASVKSVANTV